MAKEAFPFRVCSSNENRPGNESGFTLLEVILALTLTGMIVLTALSLLRNTYGLWQRNFSEDDPTRAARLLMMNMRQTVDRAYYYPYLDGKIKHLQGAADGFDLPVITESDGIGRAGLYYTEEQIFYRQFSLAHPQEAQAILLLDNVAAAKFTYLQADYGVWVDYWDDRDYPRLVRLEVSLKPKNTTGGEKRVPPLIISIPVGMECRFDD